MALSRSYRKADVSEPIFESTVGSVLRQSAEAMPTHQRNWRTTHWKTSFELSFVKSSHQPHKAPREWFFLEELPTTASGKIQKFSLRDRYIEDHV